MRLHFLRTAAFLLESMIAKFSEKEIKEEVKMSNFRTQDSGGGQVLKLTAGGWNGPVLQKDSIEADMDDVNRRVTHRTGDGEVVDLARRIAQVYRRVVAPATGVSTLTMAERRAMRDRIISAMLEEQDSPFANDKSQPTPALTQLASLFGRTDGRTDTAG
jgi:hypothetical protein